MRALLDVNVLIALLDAGHVRHADATAWLARHLKEGWASCPLTQNGCIRVMAQPAYPGELPAAQVAQRLAVAARHPAHEFWPDDISLLDPDTIDWQQVLGHRQVTDNYLLALAVHRGGRFVTFDGRVQLKAVHGAAGRHLVAL
ncbi:MAG: PIN domain-containing protein [Rubrivivax sp.]